MEELITKLKDIAEEASYHSSTHQDFNELSEYYLGYSEGVHKSIELLNKYLERRDV